MAASGDFASSLRLSTSWTSPPGQQATLLAKSPMTAFKLQSISMDTPRSDFDPYCVQHFLLGIASWHLKSDVANFRSRIATPGIELSRLLYPKHDSVFLRCHCGMQGARNEIFALLPAPVQASYMGFPATTGADFLPYLITDKVVASESCQHCYSEKLAYMPNCYFVNDYKQANMVSLEASCL